ncbi:MAG TPA: TonB family protein [Chryseolinea sp.]|nr:TonB family protein [Chryseolinea sp.]
MTQLIIVILTLLTVASFGQEKDSVQHYIFITEQMPSYPGGLDSLKDFIKKNTKYPNGTADYVGTVYVELTVIEDGSLTDFKIVRALCDACDKNAIETLKKMPKWIPATVNEKPTRTRMVIPVKYAE